MNVLSRLKNNPIILFETKVESFDIPVQNGLALTPAKVQELTARGIAVTQANGEPVFDSPSSFSDFSLNPMYQRGMDRNTLWEQSMLSKQKILSARDKLTLIERQSKEE